MSTLRKIARISLFCFLHVSFVVAQDQLLYLPPVLSANTNKDSSLSLILNTTDVAKVDGKKEVKPYSNSIQIVDADMPWPPRWYTSSPVYSDELFAADKAKGTNAFDYFLDAKVQGNFFSLYRLKARVNEQESKSFHPELAGYLLLDKTMTPFDTIRSNTAKRNLYYHDLWINSKGEKLVNIRKDTYLDLRDYTDNEKDSCVHGNVDYIQILDAAKNLKFSWNPLDHLDPELLQFKERVIQRTLMSNNDDIEEWTRLTSAIWDYDGDICYSMKNYGIGKFSRSCGNLIWQINFNQMPLVPGRDKNVLAGNDTLEWYCQHDLNLLRSNDTAAWYSVFSNGLKDPNKPTKYACGVIFELNKNTHRVKLVKYVHPQKTYVANGQGNFDYSAKDNYVFSYGNMPAEEDNLGYRNSLEYGKVGGTVYSYQLPPWIYVYKAHRLENWPRPPRPQIILKGNKLEAEGDFKNFTWYKLSGPSNTEISKAGTGKTLIPERKTIYCVEGEYGIGYSVSRPYMSADQAGKNEAY